MSYATLETPEPEVKFDALQHNLALWRELDETIYVLNELKLAVREMQDRATELGGQKALDLLTECRILKRVITTIEKGEKYGR